MRKSMLALLVVGLLAAVAPCSASEPTPEQPASCVVTPESTAVELQTQGDNLRRHKDYQEAMECYQAALRRDRNNAGLINRIGLVNLQLGRYREAQSDFEQAVKRNPKFAEALNNIGVAAYAQRNYGAAVKYLKKAVALNETDAGFHSNLGAAWFAQNKLDRAMAEYGRALELDPTILLRSMQGGVTAQISSPEERAKYSFIVAKLYAQRGDVEHALISLKKAKEDGYRNLNSVYTDEAFAALRQDARLAELIPPPR